MLRINRLARPLFRGLLILTLSIAPGLARAATVAAATGTESSRGATLTILATPVEVATAGGGGVFSTAVDGQRLYAGDSVRTGPGGVAVLTYFDGSESQLGAESQVLIEQAEATPAPQISFLQTTGVTVNHVVPLPAGGGFRTNTPSVTGLVRGTSYIVSVVANSSGTDPAAPGDDAPGTSSVTSVVLLTDRDGHVGRVDVARPASPEPAVRLTVAGEAVAGSSTTAPTRAQLDPPSVARLEAAANARKDLGAAREAERHAHALERAMAPLLASAQRAGERPSEAGKLAAPVLVLPVATPAQTTQTPATWAIAANDSPLLESRMIRQKNAALADGSNVPMGSASASGAWDAAAASGPSTGSAAASSAASTAGEAQAQAAAAASGSGAATTSAGATRTSSSPPVVEQKAPEPRRPNRGGGSSSSSSGTDAPTGAPAPSPSTPTPPSSDASAPAARSGPRRSDPSPSTSSAPGSDASAPAPSQPAATAPAPSAPTPNQPAPQASAPPAPAPSQAPPPPAIPAPPSVAVPAPAPPATSIAPARDQDKDKAAPPAVHS